jgi:arylsulfatase A-like enzyme
MKKDNQIMSLDRRKFVKQSAGLIFGGICASTFPSFALGKNKKKPLNILFLMCDQYRPDALGCYGDKNALTPNLNKLAASGMSLRQTYCQSPVCVSSRNSILNGLYSHSNGVISNSYLANTDKISYPQILRKNGYSTACFGKLHTPGREQLDWDYYDEGRERPSEEKLFDGVVLPGTANLITSPTIGAPDPYPKTETLEWRAKENTIDFMRSHTDTPWLIQCSMLKPHAPYQPPKEHWDRIDRQKIVIPDYPENDLDDCDPRYLQIIKGRGMVNMSKEHILDGMQGYYGNIAFVDDMFGEVLDELDRLNLRENTLIVFTADHGEMLNEHGLWTKFVFFDSSVRVPLILSLPGEIEPGTESKALVELIDLFPTFMELTDNKTPSSVQGKSLLPLITGKTKQHRSSVHSEYPLRGVNEVGGEFIGTSMLFDGRYKFVDNGEDSFPELYDQKTDPKEFNNIANDPTQIERINRMSAELKEWQKLDPVPNQKRVGGRQAETDS